MTQWIPLIEFVAILFLAAAVSLAACVIAANAPRRTRYTTRPQERRRHD